MSASTIIAKVKPELMTPRDGRPAVGGTEVAGRARAGRRIAIMVAVAAVALTVALTVGTIPRLRQQETVTAAAATVAAAPPRVSVVVARPMDSLAERVRVLPVTAIAGQEVGDILGTMRSRVRTR